MKDPKQPIEILRKILADIAPLDKDYDWDRLEYLPDITKRLPLPYMVFCSLLMGSDCEYIDKPAEKTAWAIPFQFKGFSFQAEHGKFGSRLAAIPPADQSVVDDLIITLNRSFPVVDRILKPFVEDQIGKGNVTLDNLFSMLDSKYWFFRNLALEAFSSVPPPAEVLRTDENRRPMAWSHDITKPQREGFFYGSAAIDSYFSRLEHLLVIMLAFRGYDASVDNLLKFIGSSWSTKMKRAFDFASDHEARELYKQLCDIKERFRNLISHGGFAKEGLSLFAHIPNVGPVPVRLSLFKDSMQYSSFYPINETSFKDTCEVFDRVDEHFKSSDTKFGFRFAESGLDLSFAADSIDEYRKAMTSEEDFEAFLDQLSDFQTSHVNMDW